MFIYKTINLTNNKIYIGQHECGKNCSKKECNYLGSGIFFKHALKKYGKENFVKELLEEGIKTYELLDEREKYWIAFYDATNPLIGYNISHGGQNGFFRGMKHKESSKSIMGKKGKEHPFFGTHRSENTKHKISESQSGENGYWYGKKQSEEILIKRSKSMKGDKNPNYGKRGKETSMYGKHHSDKSKLKASDSNPNKVKIKQIDKNTGEIIKIWDAISIAAKNLKLNIANISECCNEAYGRKTVGGFKWEYVCKQKSETKHENFTNEIINLYVNKKLSLKEISDNLKIRIAHISKILDKNNIQKIDGENNISLYSGKNKRKVIQLNKDTNEIIKIWDSVSSAGTEIKLATPGNIIKCCKGIYKSVGGFKWQYYEQN